MTEAKAAARKTREKADRRARIINCARAVAEAEGWESVTTRRLAEAIEYSQPVLYSHFPGGKAEIMNAVALEGFAQLAVVANAAVQHHRTDRTRLRAVANDYLDFAGANSAAYTAMFALPISARFASGQSEPELRGAFDNLAAVLRNRPNPPRDVETATELLWSSLHGLATLERDGRLRSNAHRDRIEQLVELFVHAP